MTHQILSPFFPSYFDSSKMMDLDFLPLLSFPLEIIDNIFSFLSLKDCLAVALVCKDFYSIIKKDQTWKNIATKKWKDIIYKNPFMGWKGYLYQRMCFATADKSSASTPLAWRSLSDEKAVQNLPSPRQSHTATYINGKIVFIGGQINVFTRFDDIFVFDPEQMNFHKVLLKGPEHPPRFARHTAVAIGHRIFVFGGYDGQGQFFGLQVFDTLALTWTVPKTKGTAPMPRTNHACCSVGKYMYLFGGNDTTNPECNQATYGTYGDFWQLDSETFTWKKLERPNTPCPRSGHHILSIGKDIYLYGGGLWLDKRKSWLNRYNDMYAFNTETLEWRSIKQNHAHPNGFISLPHWSVGAFIFTFSDALFCFDTMTNTWQKLAKAKGATAQKRFLGTATYVPEQRSVFVFGGVYLEVFNKFEQLSWKNVTAADLISIEESTEAQKSIISNGKTNHS